MLKKFFYIFITLILTLLLVSLIPQISKAGERKEQDKKQNRYYNNHKGFSIQFPQGWEIKGDAEGFMANKVLAIEPL